MDLAHGPEELSSARTLTYTIDGTHKAKMTLCCADYLRNKYKTVDFEISLDEYFEINFGTLEHSKIDQAMDIMMPLISII